MDGAPGREPYELIDAVHYAEQGETGQLTPIGRETIRVALPELGDWPPLEHETTAFDATTARVVVWTPRGNHESVVRKYAKVD